MSKECENITELDYKLLKERYSSEDLEKILNRIRNDYPVQYAIGDVEFMRNKIRVDERVLIPRFETELLVSKLGEYIDKNGLENSNMLDLCTGSGCIAIALKSEFVKSRVVAVDISDEAMNLAAENARMNGVDVEFRQMDVLGDMTLDEKFSVLVSNPPYVKLDEEVSANTKYEPRIALYPGENDTIFYERILDLSKHVLTSKNLIAFEIGSMQGEEVCRLARRSYPNSKIVLEQDYAGLDRFVFIFNNCE